MINYPRNQIFHFCEWKQCWDFSKKWNCKVVVLWWARLCNTLTNSNATSSQLKFNNHSFVFPFICFLYFYLYLICISFYLYFNGLVAPLNHQTFGASLKCWFNHTLSVDQLTHFNISFFFWVLNILIFLIFVNCVSHVLKVSFKFWVFFRLLGQKRINCSIRDGCQNTPKRSEHTKEAKTHQRGQNTPKRSKHTKEASTKYSIWSRGQIEYFVLARQSLVELFRYHGRRDVTKTTKTKKKPTKTTTLITNQHQ